MNRNLVLGIAAGAIAIVAIGIIAKKTGLFDSLMRKLNDIVDDVEDKFSDMNLEKFGLHDTIPKGEDKNVTKIAGHA